MMGRSTPTDVMAEVGERARRAGVFESVALAGSCLVCRAKGVSARYEVEADSQGVNISLRTPDRWLSESIETDLMHTGDALEELIEDELVELGVAGVGGEGAREFRVEHFRSETKEFTFRSRLPDGAASDAGRVTGWLLAYEACFRRLGDMSDEGRE